MRRILSIANLKVWNSPNPCCIMHEPYCSKWYCLTKREQQRIIFIFLLPSRSPNQDFILQALTERRQVTRRRMIASRSAEDLLSSQSKLRSSKSSVTLIPTSEKPVTCHVTACQEYSEVWEPPEEETEESPEPVPECTRDQQQTRDTCPLDSVGQDSGISSTSDSTLSYSTKNANCTQTEDLSKVPWYEAEMPRWVPIRCGKLSLNQNSAERCLRWHAPMLILQFNYFHQSSKKRKQSIRWMNIYIRAEIF